MSKLKGVMIFLVSLMIIQSVSAISNVQHSIDGNKVTLTYQGTPPFSINIRGDTNVGQSGGYLWAKTYSNSFSYDMSFAINPSKKFYYGVKDTSWSNTNNFVIGQNEPLNILNKCEIIDVAPNDWTSGDTVCGWHNKICTLVHYTDHTNNRHILADCQSELLEGIQTSDDFNVVCC